MNSHLPPSAEAVFDVIERNPMISQREIWEKLNYHWTTVRNALKDILRPRGYIREAAPDRWLAVAI